MLMVTAPQRGACGDKVQTEQRDLKSAIAVRLGLAGNLLLALLKTTIGIAGHSPALLADGINSTSDVAYYLVVAVFMHQARKPADEEHPYGHSQLEAIAAVIVGAFVLTTGIAVFWDSANAVYEIRTGEQRFGGAALITLWVALFTVGLKVVLTLYTRRLGRDTGNAAVAALAYDHRNDIFSASGAAVGILLGRLGYPWVDPLAGSLVALVILKTGISILRDASAELMDAVPSALLGDQIARIVATIQGVNDLEEMHAHRFGPYMVINVTIGVDGAQTVARGDEIASRVEQAIKGEIEYVRSVHVHYHPAAPARRPGGPELLHDCREPHGEH